MTQSTEHTQPARTDVYPHEGQLTHALPLQCWLRSVPRAYEDAQHELMSKVEPGSRTKEDFDRVRELGEIMMSTYIEDAKNELQ